MVDTQKFSAWITAVMGKYINMDGAYGAQCWDLAAHWSTFLGLPVINTGGVGRWPGWAGNMVDAFPQSAEIAAAYELIGPGDVGQPGDIVVWGAVPGIYPATHVAVLVRDMGALLNTMSQNSTPSVAGNPYPGESTGPTTLQNLPRTGLLGFIRPRTGGLAPQGNINTSEEDDVVTEADRTAIAKETIEMLFSWVLIEKDRGGNPTGHTANLSWFLLSAAAAEKKNRELTVDAVVDGLGNKRLPKIGADGQPKPNDYTTHNIETSWTAYNAAQSKALIEQLAVKQGVVIDYDLIATKVADELGNRIGGN